MLTKTKACESESIRNEEQFHLTSYHGLASLDSCHRIASELQRALLTSSRVDFRGCVSTDGGGRGCRHWGRRRGCWLIRGWRQENERPSEARVAGHFALFQGLAEVGLSRHD